MSNRSPHVKPTLPVLHGTETVGSQGLTKKDEVQIKGPRSLKSEDKVLTRDNDYTV